MEILIHMKSGKTLTMRGKDLDMSIGRNSLKQLISLSWEGIEYGDSPHYIDIDQIEAITTTRKGVSDA